MIYNDKKIYYFKKFIYINLVTSKNIRFFIKINKKKKMVNYIGVLCYTLNKCI